MASEKKERNRPNEGRKEGTGNGIEGAARRSDGKMGWAPNANVRRAISPRAADIDL